MSLYCNVKKCMFNVWSWALSVYLCPRKLKPIHYDHCKMSVDAMYCYCVTVFCIPPSAPDAKDHPQQLDLLTVQATFCLLMHSVLHNMGH